MWFRFRRADRHAPRGAVGSAIAERAVRARIRAAQTPNGFYALYLVKSTWGYPPDGVLHPLIRRTGANVSSFPPAEGTPGTHGECRRSAPAARTGRARSRI